MSITRALRHWHRTKCGSSPWVPGQPSSRPKQASACWLVELGNGDKFLFDLGAGCHERIAAQKIPYDFIDKVFLSHLHVDHYGDLASFWLGGTVMNRLTPLRIWGPSGATPEFGTKYALDLMEKMYIWDVATRAGFVDFRGGELEVHEFPYDGVNNVIFDENGVVIRSIPAIHAIDGAVSFILEWNGLKFVYGGDTFPNKWYVEHAKGADLAIHECFLPPTLMITKQGFTPSEGLMVASQAHSSPEQFGKVMSMVKPRIGVGYHFYNDFDTAPEVLERVRKTYSGPARSRPGLHGLQRDQGRHPGADVRHRRGHLAKPRAQAEEPARHLEDDPVLRLHQVRRARLSGGRGTDFRRSQREVRNQDRADMEIAAGDRRYVRLWPYPVVHPSTKNRRQRSASSSKVAARLYRPWTSLVCPE